MKRKTKAIFLTALVIYASGNTTTINKNKSNDISLKSTLKVQSEYNKDENERPQEIMFLFEHQQTPIVQKIQESSKIKKKYKRKLN